MEVSPHSPAEKYCYASKLISILSEEEQKNNFFLLSIERARTTPVDYMRKLYVYVPRIFLLLTHFKVKEIGNRRIQI